MLDAAREAISFAEGQTRADLDADRKLNLSLVRLIEIIGEAADQVSADTQERRVDIPWADIIGMRHRLIHGYSDVDLDIVWHTDFPQAFWPGKYSACTAPRFGQKSGQNWQSRLRNTCQFQEQKWPPGKSVWQVVTKDLPPLVAALEKILRSDNDA